MASTETATEAPGDDTPPPAAPAAPGRGRRIATAAWLLPLAVVLVAGGLRFYRLGEPPRIYFDETYYVEDARQYLAQGVEEGFAVHPPVGKWLIAGGIAAVGDTPVGWRTAPAVAGTLTALLTYLAGLRLFRRRGFAALAGFLVAVDGLAFTMSRIAMLDAMLTMFVVLGFWLLLVDRDRMWAGARERPADDGEGRPSLPRRPRGWRLAAGVALGLATATKWSGLLAIGGAGLFLLGSELAFRRRTTGSPWTAWPRLVVGTGLTMVLLPAVIYLVSYAGWFANFERTRLGDDPCPYSAAICEARIPRIARTWMAEQAAIAGFHAELTADHPYESSPVGWPVLARPIAYHYVSCGDQEILEGTCEVPEGLVAEVLGIGNPAIWWLALPAYLALAWFGFARRAWPAHAILTFLLALYVPWLATARPAFLFYMAPVAPFICLALGYASLRAFEHPLLRWLPAAVAALATAAFLWWYPVLAALPVSRDVWQLRMLFRSWI
jgi:dolichyl-phosphate-mannose-protein mannosyltransferase